MSLLSSTIIAASVPNFASKRITMEVRNLKTGQVETRLSIPLWLAQTGSSIAKILNVGSKEVDLPALIKEIEKNDRTGTILEIENHKDNEKVSFALDKADP